MKNYLNLAAFVAAGLLSLVSPAAQASVLAYETSGTAFGVVDLTTGQFTFLGSGGLVYAGLGNYGGNLYAGINTGTNFYQVNPANGALTFIGNSGVSIVATGSTTATPRFPTKVPMCWMLKIDVEAVSAFR